MGFFEKLFGKHTIPVSEETQAPSQGEATPGDILETGTIPPKPSLLREDFFCDTGDSGEEVEIAYQFLLSGDFVEFNSHAEPECCHQYEPFSAETFTGYNANLPCFMLSDEDAVWEAVAAFKETGTVGTDCRPVKAGKMLFRAKIPYFNQVMTLYGFDRGNSWDNYGMCMVYNRDVEGTPLEDKLLAALDEAAATYQEQPANK